MVGLDDDDDEEGEMAGIDVLDDGDDNEGEMTGVDVPDGLVASELSIWIPASPHHESYAHSK